MAGDSNPPLSRPRLGRNVFALAAVSFLTDVSSDMTYPLLPLFLSSVLGASATAVGAIEGAAETTAALLKLASGWWSDRVSRRKPLVLAGYTLASLVRPLIGLAQSVGQVLAIRVTDRVGKGIRTSPRDALIADSVDPAIRGRAFGFHRAADNAGRHGRAAPRLRVPGLGRAPAAHGLPAHRHSRRPGGADAALRVREVQRAPQSAARKVAQPLDLKAPLGKRFWAFLGVLLLFTLGNSTDAFLILRARQLGVRRFSFRSSGPCTAWSSPSPARRGNPFRSGWPQAAHRRRLVRLCGRLLLLRPRRPDLAAWALFAVYGVYFGLTEGVEKALVADLVPEDRRGAAFGWYNLALGIGALTGLAPLRVHLGPLELDRGLRLRRARGAGRRGRPGRGRAGSTDGDLTQPPRAFLAMAP